MNWRIQFVFFINVSWLTSVCKWGTLICSPCSRVILYFFPWLKRTFLMWHPPSAHIRTHEHARGGIGGRCTRRRHAASQTRASDYRQQFDMRVPSKRRGECAAARCSHQTEQLDAVTGELGFLPAIPGKDSGPRCPSPQTPLRTPAVPLCSYSMCAVIL